jgi:hypothetical protein
LLDSFGLEILPAFPTAACEWDLAMAQIDIAPPPTPPRVALGDNSGSGRVQLRLWQLWLTLVTVLITAWLITLGPIPAIIAIVTAKHVLVAILVMGLGVDAKPRTENSHDDREHD